MVQYHTSVRLRVPVEAVSGSGRHIGHGACDPWVPLWHRRRGGLPPAVKKHLDGGLYPFDSAFFELQLRLSFFDEFMAALSSMTHLPLDWTFFSVYCLSTFLLVLVLRQLAERFFEDERARWAAVLLPCALLTLPVAGSALFIMDQHLHPRNLATIAMLFALVAALDRRRFLACALMAPAALLHPMMALYGGVARESFLVADAGSALPWVRFVTAVRLVPFASGIRCLAASLPGLSLRDEMGLVRVGWHCRPSGRVVGVSALGKVASVAADCLWRLEAGPVRCLLYLGRSDHLVSPALRATDPAATDAQPAAALPVSLLVCRRHRGADVPAPVGARGLGAVPGAVRRHVLRAAAGIPGQPAYRVAGQGSGQCLAAGLRLDSPQHAEAGVFRDGSPLSGAPGGGFPRLPGLGRKKRVGRPDQGPLRGHYDPQPGGRNG